MLGFSVKFSREGGTRWVTRTLFSIIIGRAGMEQRYRDN